VGWLHYARGFRDGYTRGLLVGLAVAFSVSVALAGVAAVLGWV
jgi:hypothetical protein